jgi:hypothetical protein
MKYTDVFVPGGFPQYTYNPRTEIKLEEHLNEGKENLCKLIAITGQTKSGKTVVTKKIYPKDQSVWIDGGSVKSEDDFWQQIIDQLEYFQGSSEITTSEKQGSSTKEDNYSAALAGVGSSKRYSINEQSKESTATSRVQSLSSKVAAIKILTKTKTALVIDDFHYISRDLQGDIIRALKGPIFEGTPVIIIAIPHKRYDAVKVEKEMTGRVSQVQVPTWQDEELLKIPELGFELLGMNIDPEVTNSFTKEAIGSPHLMQEFCRSYCRESDKYPIKDIDIHRIYESIADQIGKPIFEKLAKGPRQRADRMQRRLKDGSTVDIYGLILKALAFLKPGLVSLEYEDLRHGIREVAEPPAPQLHEVARVLKHMATIAATDESSAPVIDFDEKEKKLHITDPFFSFYLKWGKI